MGKRHIDRMWNLSGRPLHGKRRLWQTETGYRQRHHKTLYNSRTVHLRDPRILKVGEMCFSNPIDRFCYPEVMGRAGRPTGAVLDNWRIFPPIGRQSIRTMRKNRYSPDFPDFPHIFPSRANPIIAASP